MLLSSKRVRTGNSRQTEHNAAAESEKGDSAESDTSNETSESVIKVCRQMSLMLLTGWW